MFKLNHATDFLAETQHLLSYNILKLLRFRENQISKYSTEIKTSKYQNIKISKHQRIKTSKYNNIKISKHQKYRKHPVPSLRNQLVRKEGERGGEGGRGSRTIKTHTCAHTSSPSYTARRRRANHLDTTTPANTTPTTATATPQRQP